MVKNINDIVKKKRNVKSRFDGEIKNNNALDVCGDVGLGDELDLSLYVCECGGKFKRFGKRSLNQYICECCGFYVPLEKMYLYKVD